jgi:transcriptional regulator with GAF, ATPase, and Fis domain
MRIDENEFFRQATLRICGSLDIGKAMVDCIRYIKEYIPISELSLSRLDPDLGFIRNLVTVSPSLETKILPPIALPRDITRIAEDLSSQWEEVVIENNPKQHPVMKNTIPHYKTRNPSIMYMILVIEGTYLGAVTILAQGQETLKKPHARLFSLLREPFAIAMSNAIKFQEVVKLKEIIDAENRELHRELLSTTDGEIIGADSGLAGVMEMVRQVAPLVSPVMLLGETGVGKEVIANVIHHLSSRASGPFIKVNCGAIPDGLLDAELFGHEKGAFTGAIVQKRGRFERADKGSIFLDEIAELPPKAQVKMLRVLQHKEIERVGGTQVIPVDVRIITATNKNLEELLKSGEFREDLWYRLNIFPIMIPPLRQRKEDIPALVHHFIEKKAKDLKIHTPPTVSPQGMDRLQKYIWPGNIRELENLIERELIRRRGLKDTGLLNFETLNPLEPRNKISDLMGIDQIMLSIDEVMSQHIRKALHQTKGKIFGPGGAAHLLGINPNTLRSRMKKLGIILPPKYSPH